MLPKSRSQKAYYNIVTMAISEVASTLSYLILPRLILVNYGSAYNGIASSASQFLSLISVLTMGVTASTRVALYKTLAQNDQQGTSSIVRATELYMRRIAIALMIYILGLAGLYPLIVQTGFTYLDVASVIIVTGIGAFAEYYFGITYRTLLLADQSVYISNIFTTVSTILSLFVYIIFVNLGSSFQIVKLGAASIHVLKLILQNIYVTKHYKLAKKVVPDLSALKTRKDAMAHALANIVHDNTDIVILTLFTDVKTVSVYTIYNMVMSALKKVQLIFNTGVEPIFGNMWANGEIEKMRLTLEFYEYFGAFFCSIVYSTTLVTLLPFIEIYTKGVTDVKYIRPVYAIVITAAFVIQGIRTPYVSFIGGIGHYKQTKNDAIIEAVLNLVISVVLVNFIGMVGVAVGTLVANLYRTIRYGVYIDNHIIKRGKVVFVRKIVWCIGNIIILYCVYAAFLSRFVVSDWRDWFLFAGVVFVCASVISVISSLIFYRKDFFTICNRIKNTIFAHF